MFNSEIFILHLGFQTTLVLLKRDALLQDVSSTTDYEEGINEKSLNEVVQGLEVNACCETSHDEKTRILPGAGLDSS